MAKRLALHIGIIDNPGKRKVHQEVIPKLGGLAVFIGIALALIVGSFFYPDILTNKIVSLLFCATLVVMLGFCDDWLILQAPIKLLGQIAIALITIALGISITFIQNPLTGSIISLGIWSTPLTVLWILGFMNTINLIDGLDGLAAGIALISGASLLIISFILNQTTSAYILIALIGATLAFLRFNFNPASIFMGDTGSLLLGYLLAICTIEGVLKSSALITIAMPILSLLIPLTDTLLAIIRRTSRGVHIFKADAEHIHHRLLLLGYSHKQSVLIMYAASCIVNLCAIALALTTGPASAFLMLCVIITLGIALRALRPYFITEQQS